MTHHTSRATQVLAVSLLAIAVTACGGGSDAPPAVAIAADDLASVDWNTASALAVLSNDTVQNGTASVTIQTPPAHGTATVSGTQITYTPAAGYFGSDSLRYTLSVGDRTADAGVQLTVAAVLKLAGTVRDKPLPGATVTATVGSTALPPVTADAGGNYSIPLRVTDPAAFISLKAKGVGAQSGVVLSSLVGDAAEAAALAALSAGTVSAAALPGANVTHVSTAFAVLTQQALGKAVASAADLKAAQGSFSASQAIEMAAAIKLVADSGIALPAGTADTLALVSDAAAFKAFVVAQATSNATAYNAVVQSVLGDAALAVPPQTPSAANPADRTLLAVQGEGASASPAIRLTLKANGSAVVESDALRSAKWLASSTEITVTYDTPAVTQGYSADIDAQGNQAQIETSQSGFVLRQVGGSSSGGPASVKPISSTKYLDGAKAGTVVNDVNEWDAQTLVGATLAFTAADVAIGTRWAGVLALGNSAASPVAVDQDVIRVVDASTVSFERDGRTGSYKLVDGKLEVRIDGVVYTYTRLFAGPRGEQRWLAVKTVAGVVQWAYDAAVVKAQAGAAFTVAGLTQRWESYINVGVAAGKFIIDLRADGTGVGISQDAPGATTSTTSAGLWTLNGDGSMTLKRYNCDVQVAGCTPFHQRSWALLAATDKRIYVMERLKIGTSIDQYRVNVYTKP